MTHAGDVDPFLKLPLYRGLRAYLWARIFGGFVLLHHLLFGLIWLTEGTEVAMMAVTLSTSGLWFLLALGASMGFVSKTVYLWHFLEAPENAPPQEPTQAAVFAWFWSRRLALSGVALGLSGLALAFIPQVAGLGVWLVISGMIAGAYAFALYKGVPNLAISRTTQRNRTRAAESTPRARRRKSERLWKEAVLVALIPVAILHNVVLGWLGFENPTSVLGNVLYFGALIVIMLLIAFNWVQYRTRTEEKI